MHISGKVLNNSPIDQMHSNDEPQVMALIQYAVFPEPQSNQPPVPATETAAASAWQVRDVESLGTDRRNDIPGSR